MKDPNPAVAGRGLTRLKRAGIEVHLCENETCYAQEMNEDFAKWIRTGLPFVTLKTALTLDGQIAERAGSVTWITSERSRESVQQLRHEADVLLTGVGTVLVDDPRMSDRTGLPRRRKLLRAIVDSRLRTPLRSRLVKSAQSRMSSSLPRNPPIPRKLAALVRAGVEVFHVRAQQRRVDLHAVIAELGKRQMLNVPARSRRRIKWCRPSKQALWTK